MRPIQRLRIGLLCALLLAIIGTATGQVAVQVQVAGPLPVPADAKKDDKKKAASVEVMTFPSDRDAKNMIQAVKDYIKEYEGKEAKAPWDRVCQAAQTVLDAKSDSFFELPKTEKDATQGRVSAKAEVNRLIGTFPPAGRQFYQLNYGPQAENLLSQAKDNNYDRALLAEISQRYYHTKAGAQSTLLLAGVQLDRGNYIEAAYSFERLLARPDSDDLWTPGIIVKTIVALRRSGSGNTVLLAKLNEKLEAKFPRDGLTIGRKQYSLDELRAEINKPFESLHGRVGEQFVSMRYGNASHTALGEGGKPFLDPAWSTSLFHRNADPAALEGSTWVSQNLDDVLRSIRTEKQEVALPGFFPVTAQNILLYRAYDGLHATITKDGFSNHGQPSLAGQPYWFSPTLGGAASLITRPLEGLKKEEIEARWKYFRHDIQHQNKEMKSILFENPLVGSLSHDGQLAYLIDDAALPPQPQDQNNEMGFVMVAGANGAAPAVQNSARKNDLINGNILRAVDLHSGKNAWQLGSGFGITMTDEEEDKSTNTLLLMQNSFFLGPPLPLNGKLYILYERNGVIRLACVDPAKTLPYKEKKTRAVEDPTDPKHEKTINVTSETTHFYPALMWVQRLGEPNARLPMDTLRRFQCSYLAYADGVMICPTNAGAVIAVDIMSRSLLWARSYRSLKTTTDDAKSGVRRRVFVNGGEQNTAGGLSVLRQDRWRAAAPMISQGRVVFAAFDSDALYCLDLRSGDIHWREPQKAGDLYIGGLVNDSVLIVGKENIRSVKLFGTAKKEIKDAAEGKEDVARPWKDIKIGLPAGHGTASKDGVYYLPVAQVNDDPQVWAIDAVKGEVQAKASYRRKDPAGGRAYLGNLLFHEGQLYCQSALELCAFPLIELKKQEMNRLLSANAKDPAGLVARGEMSLDEGKLSEAIADFQAAATGTAGASVKHRLREKLYTAYTELLRKDFAAAEPFLNDYKMLCDVATDAEDPNMRLRQVEEKARRQRQYLELLARGREKQGRLADAFDAYREFASFGGAKELVSISDELTNKVRPDIWAKGRIEAMIAGAKDPATRKPLEDRVNQEWTAVKGGTDLVKLRDFVGVFGNHFDSGREAQLLLGTTLAKSTVADDQREAVTILNRLAATATDASLAAKATEEMARLHVQRGQIEAAVGLYIALGTTFADVTIREGVTGADIFNDRVTDKRLQPFLESSRLPSPARIRATKDASQNQNFTANAYVIDPDGGDREPFFQRHRITLINNEQNGQWTLRVADKASGDEKWKIGNLQMYNPGGYGVGFRVAQARGNLILLHMGIEVHCLDLAERKHLWKYPVFGEGNRVDINNMSVTKSVDDEIEIADGNTGTKFTLGRTTVLEANYAAIVTRDGLIVLDPITKSKLWTKTNISPSSIIFGDARHIFVVESGAKSASRVFRAADGALVEGVPDFAALAVGSGRVRIVGRNLLLTESSRSKPMILRLYDPLSGKDVWRKEFAPVPEPEDYKGSGFDYDGRAKLIKTYGGEVTGAFLRDGRFELLNIRTGEVVFKSQIDKANAELHGSMAGQPTLLSDAERHYLILNKTAESRNASMSYYYGGNQLRTLTIDGPMYCFEKATSRRAWYTERLMEKQSLIIERFAEMPALVTATFTTEDDPNEAGGLKIARANVNFNNNSSVYRVAVIDKANGRLRLLNNLSQGQYFQSISTNPLTATAKLHRGDISITIEPNETGKPDLATETTPENAPPIQP